MRARSRRYAFQREADVPRRLKTQIGRLLETMPYDALECCRRVAGSGRNVGGILTDDGVERFDGRSAPEWTLPREHFVQHDTEAEDVRPMVDPCTSRLLRRHVADRSDDHPRVSGLFRDRIRRKPRRLGNARDTEVEDLHASFARDEQVLRFEVAVDDPAIVRRGQACGDIGSQPDRARRRERRAGEQRA